jgi:hypothetical protein
VSGSQELHALNCCARSDAGAQYGMRVLEQKVNASDKLSEADKFEFQLRKRSVAPTEFYALTRCYGSLTTFNILFKNKDDQFRTSAQSSAVGKPNS